MANSDKIIKPFFLILILCLIIPTFCLKTREFIDSEENSLQNINRLHFYKNIAEKFRMKVLISLDDNNNLVIKSGDDQRLQMTYPKNLMLNSCEYFPYFEDIYKAFFAVDKKILDENFSHSMFLTFKIMYYLYGDHKAAEQYFQEHPEVITYTLTPELMKYLEMIPKLNNRNIFYLNDEEIQLAKRLNISMRQKDAYLALYKATIENLGKIEEKEKRVIFLFYNFKFFNFYYFILYIFISYRKKSFYSRIKNPISSEFYSLLIKAISISITSK